MPPHERDGTGPSAGSLIERRQRRVLDAARAWRRAYHAWIQDETKYDESGASVRDMRKNGENRALSRLLDALQALDQAEAGRERP